MTEEVRFGFKLTSTYINNAERDDCVMQSQIVNGWARMLYRKDKETKAHPEMEALGFRPLAYMNFFRAMEGMFCLTDRSMTTQLWLAELRDYHRTPFGISPTFFDYRADQDVTIARLKLGADSFEHQFVFPHGSIMANITPRVLLVSWERKLHPSWKAARLVMGRELFVDLAEYLLDYELITRVELDQIYEVEKW